jgi:integrase
VTYFGDAVLLGARAPRDFGVRVTAGIRSFVINYGVAGVERRIAIGQHPDWPVLRAVKQARELRQQIDRCRGDQAQRYRYVGRIMNWHASRSDDFRSPIERGVARVSAKERARDRVLDDDELKAVWRAAEATERLFGRLVNLLSGCRRSEAPGMARSNLI